MSHQLLILARETLKKLFCFSCFTFSILSFVFNLKFSFHENLFNKRDYSQSRKKLYMKDRQITRHKLLRYFFHFRCFLKMGGKIFESFEIVHKNIDVTPEYKILSPLF